MKPAHRSISNIHSRRRRGLAMVLVICAMALAAILSYAILSAASLQATAATNGQSAAIADAQAESGIQLALYYLLKPQNAPSLTTNNGVTYWPGASNITFATTATTPVQMPGSATVTVGTPVVNPTAYTNTFTVTSTGSSGAGSGAGSIMRTITTQIQVNTGYNVSNAGTFNASLSIGNGIGSQTFTAINGANAIVSNQSVTIGLLGIVSGNISAPSLGSGSILANLLGSLIPGPATGTSPAPKAADVFHLTANQYQYNGAWYTATALGSSIASNTTLGAVPGTNPLGVYYTTASTTMNSNVTISGTLLVQNGTLTISGTNNTITAAASMPALVISNQLKMNGGTAKLTVNGVVWASAGVTGAGLSTTAKLAVNGALLTDTAGVTSYNGGLTVYFDPTNPLVSVPTLSSANQVPQSVKILSWTQ